MSDHLTPRDIAEARYRQARAPEGEIDSVGPWEEQLELGGETSLARVVQIYRNGEVHRYLFIVEFNYLGAAVRSRYELTKIS